MHHHPWPHASSNVKAIFTGSVLAVDQNMILTSSGNATRMKSFLMSSVIMRDDSGAITGVDGKQSFDLQLSANSIEAQQRGGRRRTSYSLHDIVGAGVVDDPKLGAAAAVLKLHAYPASSSK
jgi:hypothetical protein